MDSHRNVSPHVYLLATFLTTVGTLFIYNTFGFENHWFLAPLIFLAAVYGGINFYRQSKGKSESSTLNHINWRKLLRQAAARYLVWLAVIYSALLLYHNLPHSLYNPERFQANFLFFSQLINGYLILGFPYFLITLIVKSSRREDFYDPAVRLIHIGKQLVLGLIREDRNKTAYLVLRNKYNRKVLLNLVMRAYFVPIMIIQVLGTTLANLDMIHSLQTDAQLLGFLYFASTVLWLMDIINATLSYSLESRWLENRSRSIDMTLTGWLVCFCCYEPLNRLTGYLFPFAPFIATQNPQDLIIPNADFLIFTKVI
jgi:hypothetical protein